MLYAVAKLEIDGTSNMVLFDAWNRNIFTRDKAITLARKMNEMVSLYGSQAKFYITPILDI